MATERTISQSLLQPEQGPSIVIKILTIDNEFTVTIPENCTISQIKQKIFEKSSVPINRQRLIFRGKFLKNEDQISKYKITNLDVIHLVAKIGDTINDTTLTEQSDNIDGEHINQSLPSSHQ